MPEMFRYVVLISLLLPLSTAEAVQFTGRFSMLGSTAQADRGDYGYTDSNHRLLTADQQSLRLMLDDSDKDSEWSVHVKTVRQHLDGYPVSTLPSSSLFRYDELSNDWLSESSSSSSTNLGAEVDRAVYKRRFANTALSLGRQAIDWGSGRFWQPLNVFGAFAPTDLDTDYKPGIDAATFDWYPSAFSSLTAAYVWAPKDNSKLENSGAVYYRGQAGEQSEFSLLAGSVIGNRVFGGSFEGAIGGMGWRIEGVHYHLEELNKDAVFWITGIDYQFDNGTLVAAEWYDNTHGATTESALASAASDSLVVYGLQQQLSRHVLGLTLEKDLTPLLHGGYTLLAAAVDDKDNDLTPSFLHQFNVTYSVSNESDLLVSFLLPDGKGLNNSDQPQSEFGHLPKTITLRLRFYF